MTWRASREQSSFSAFISDQWRATPTLTISGGVRWDLHNPFTPADETWSLATIEDICGISGTGDGPGDRGCNIFNPRAQSGTLIPAYDHFDAGVPAHKTNWFDFAPNVGVAWRPNVQSGWLKALLGDPEQAVVRAGYALSYNQERIDRFTANAGANPGGTLGVTRDLGTGYPLVLPGESAPVLLSQRSRLGPPPYPEAPVYPIAATTANSVNIFPQDRHLTTPRVHSYSVGVQRSDRQGHGLRGPLRRQQEHQHVGGRGLERAQRVQQRVLRGVQAGAAQHLGEHRRRASAARGFAYTGAPGTSPLPIHLAYLQGNVSPNNPANYTSTNFTNQAFVNRFSALRPQVTGALAAIDTAAFRTNALAAGLPRNLIVMNPMVSSANVVMDNNWTKYNSLQLELRRRLSQGLLIGANYTYGIKESSLLDHAGGAARRGRCLGRSQLAARLQSELGLRAADRPRPALRVGHEPRAQRHRRRLAVLRVGPRQARPLSSHRREARRDDGSGAAGRVQDSTSTRTRRDRRSSSASPRTSA